MSASVDRFDERVRREADRFGETIVHRGELLRHPVYTRVLHWLVAISFVLALLSGFAIYSPWLFRWLSPLFGGGPGTRMLHPWFGVAFDVFFFFQFLNWFAPMAWTSADRRWLKRLKQYTTHTNRVEPEEVGFFNGGQKLYFWLIVLSGLLFLITGLLMWFDDFVGRWIVAVSYVVHDLAGLLMLAGFIIHIYEGTSHQPGTLHSMINGTVTEKWAWTHHPAWYRHLRVATRKRTNERDGARQSERAIASWEREQSAQEDARESGLYDRKLQNREQ